MPQQENQQQKGSSSTFNKILWIIVGVLVAYNIKLYLNSRSSAHFEINGNEITMQNDALYLKDSDLQTLSKKLSENPQTTKLNAQLSINQFSNFRDFFASLEKLNNLNELQLSLGNNPLVNEQDQAKSLSQALSKLTKLHTLSLGLDSIFNNESREIILKGLSKISGLTQLRVSLINSDLSGDGLKSLYPLIELRNLKSLELLLVGSKLKEEEMKHLQTILHKLPKLNKLNINLYANKIQIDGAITLSGGLFQQKQLKEFGIDLYFNNITANGTESLMGVVGSMENLTSLNLGLEFNYITNEGGIQVGNALNKLKNLKDLSVNAATKNFGWDGYEAIVSAIEKLPPLNNLELIIGINKCGSPGAELLKKALFKHDRLKSLKINFLENYIGDAGATFIAEGIQYQKNLQQLSVNMNFNSLSDRGALELARAVKNAKSPKVVDLRVSQNQITDKGIKDIFVLLEQALPKIDQLEVELLNTALTNATRDDIELKYGKIDKLQIRLNTIPPSNWE
ncbi:unnamed protein product [Paramecium primaurelia]|uniref:Uncharacterized protein n=1 Tax=Paramecium primaurelia TaxID=5886 RepID=A0A8S1NA47_PARPR|nr:unnamed protein product [Paramecium primaurelia]